VLTRAKVDFKQEDGTVIRNIISDSGDADVKNLHMTYVFELNYPHIAEGTEEEAQEVKKMKGVSRLLFRPAY
jgi:hypothetical protein